MKFLLLAILVINPAFSQTPHHGHENHAEVKRKDLAESEKKVILDVLKKNDDLFNAFLKKDGAQVEKLAKELHAIVSKAESKVLSGVKKESQNLLSLKAGNSNEKNLASYESFINPLIEVVKTHNVGDKYNVFSCPMVKKSWLQDVAVNKDVKNVYAMDMLECGTQETHF